MKAMALDWLVKALIVYVFILVVLYFYQRNMVYFPDVKRPNATEWGIVDYSPVVQVQSSDGLNIEGWYFSSENKEKPIIVMFHGNAGHIAHRLFKLPKLIEAGYSVLLAEYRGYGGNPGKPSEEGLYKDARAYLDWLINEEGIQEEDIILHGESLGTGVAVQMATEYNVGGVVLESAYDSVVNVAKKTYFFVPVRLLMKDQYSSVEKITGMEAPLLMVHGQKDRIIPISFAKNLFDHALEPKKIVIIPEAGHNDLYKYDVSLHILKFLSNMTDVTKH